MTKKELEGKLQEADCAIGHALSYKVKGKKNKVSWEAWKRAALKFIDSLPESCKYKGV